MGTDCAFSWIASIADLEGCKVSQGSFEISGQSLAISLPFVQGSLGVLQLPLGLIQPPPQLLYCLILAAQLSL